MKGVGGLYKRRAVPVALGGYEGVGNGPGFGALEGEPWQPAEGRGRLAFPWRCDANCGPKQSPAVPIALPIPTAQLAALRTSLKYPLINREILAGEAQETLPVKKSLGRYQVDVVNLPE